MTQEIMFPSGSTGTTVSGAIQGHQTSTYRLSLRAGQFLTLSLISSSPSIYFSVYAPGGGPGSNALATSDRTSSFIPGVNRFEAQLQATGTYMIVAQLQRPAAQRNELAAFVLNIAATDRAVQLPGSAGNPDFEVESDTQLFRVTGIASGDFLNVRAGAGTSFRVIGRLASGEVVRSRGCTTIASGARWCEISRAGSTRLSGWVSARYLTASPGDNATQLPGDALVPGTNFNATGQLTCTIGSATRNCAFGIIRRGSGNGTLSITMPNGRTRVIEFLSGRPVSSNSIAGMDGQWQGDSIVVRIGTEETYIIFDAIIWGG